MWTDPSSRILWILYWINSTKKYEFSTFNIDNLCRCWIWWIYAIDGARKMEDEGIEPNTCSWSNRYGQKVVPVDYMCTARLTAHTDWISCTYMYVVPIFICIWLHSLVIHFAGSSIYNSFLYDIHRQFLLYRVGILKQIWTLESILRIGLGRGLPMLDKMYIFKRGIDFSSVRRQTLLPILEESILIFKFV